MPRPTLTEREVRELIAGLLIAERRVDADKVARLWDEVQSLRDRESVTMQMHNIEDWS